MTRKNSEIAFGARNLQLVHLLVNERAFRRDDGEIDWAFRHFQSYFTAAILSACSSDFFDRSDHVEGLFGNVVVLAFDDFLEALDRVGDLSRTCLSRPVNCCGHEERLRQESLNLARASNNELVFFGQFVDTKNRDDVLQVLVLLQDRV